MPDPGDLDLADVPGERLTTEAYRRDFRLRDGEVTGRNSWKLERRQQFEEGHSPSWDAFLRGDWQEALRLHGEKRDRWERIAREDRARGSVFHRVRVVEEPLTPYLQWELHALRVQGESGSPVRVVSAEKVRPLEAARPLPEVVTLGGRVLYEVRYTQAGLLDGAVRHTEPGLVARWERFVAGLYEDGEDIASYVDRRVASLPAPRLTTG
ncbi:DUF6879 family protein [Streptomyces montanisoli]|uniref:DUF6879 domain-containing protein n=1 Tax=Streptomyces montanisoli TaxID=2798581 RepID=A0A940MB42_9ACTN|nr:DUF6879 family protein [Streptomyces montanisoli]MBP0457712.1 hypothetical protein [Streptomyces montanisoli]